jgi:hypothetical protein
MMSIDKNILEDAINAGVDAAIAEIRSIFNLHNCLTTQLPVLIRAQLGNAKVKKGYVLVPIVPTDEMIEELTHEWYTVGATSMYDNYTAMIKDVSND